mgnify:CR=1 FL=1
MVNKWSGEIGYAESVETKPGTWTESIVERTYYGDLTRNTRRLENSQNINDNITVANEISIVADPYALENFHAMRYVTFLGTKWKVSSVDVMYPRLRLTLGGIYT